MNKFISILEHIGHEFKRGFNPALKIAETAGEVAVSIFAPQLGSLFNQTVAQIALTEQNFTAIGKQTGSGPQKLAAVVQSLGGLIKQGLADMGKANDDAAVEHYVTSIVTILNAIPAPTVTAGALPAPVVTASIPQVSRTLPAGESPQAPSTLDPTAPLDSSAPILEVLRG